MDEHPDLPWSTIDRDVVRIELADILIQGHRNGLLKSLDNNIHEYARQLAAGDDVQLVASAVQVLSILDDASDVPTLEAIARGEQRVTFRPTVLALTRMCNAAASQALDRLQSSITDPLNRQFIDETRQSMDDFKRRSEACRAR